MKTLDPTRFASRDSSARRYRREKGDLPVDRCSASGCPGVPTHGKPWCMTHLENLPYVRILRAELEEREAELAGLAQVRKDGVAAREVVEHLRGRADAVDGVNGIALVLGVKKDGAREYLERLAATGVVEMLEVGSRRGTPREVVRLKDGAA